MTVDFAKVTLTRNGSNARTLLVQLRLTGSEGADDDAEPADDCEVLQPLGLAARPVLTSTTEAAYVRVGDEVIVLGLLDKGDTAFDLEAGETRVYNRAGAQIRMRANGDIEVLPASGRKVYVGGVSGAEPIGLGTSIKNQLDAIRAAFNAHTHAGSFPVTGGGGGTASGTTAAPSSSIGATPDVEADNASAK